MKEAKRTKPYKRNLPLIKRVKYLRDVSGLSYREIARRIGKDVKQVWRWYHYKTFLTQEKDRMETLANK